MLRRRSDFLRVQSSGRRFKTSRLAVLVAGGEGRQARVGFTVSRKVGKAVVRNRVRRRLRELVRQDEAHLAMGFDHVLIAYPPAAEASFDELERDVTWLLSQAHAWASQRA